MKKLGIYFVAVCAAVLTVACEKTDADGYAVGEGGVVMNLANTRAVDMSGRTLADCTTFIYQKGTDAETSQPTKTLIRKYAPGNCPERIKLLAGSYSVKVQWGERPAAAASDKCFYEGSADFTITEGRTEHVTVSCKPQSTAVEVVFDSNIAKTLSAYSVEVALPDDKDPKTTDALTFTEAGTGYFTLPEGVATLDWSFSATHPEKGDVHKAGRIGDVEAGKKYTLTFKYSPDLPGYISIGIEIAEPDYHNDVMVFSKDPVVSGEVFVAPQNFTSENVPEERSVTMSATGDAPLTAARIYWDGGNKVSPASTRADNGQQLYWEWTETGGASDEKIATALRSDDKKTLTVTFLCRNVLSANGSREIESGKSDFRFEVEDEVGGKADKTMTVRVEGLCPVSEADYDLWANTVTLHAVSFQGEPTFTLQQQVPQDGGSIEWEPVNPVNDAESSGGPTVAKVDEYEYTATFAAEWSASKNVNNLDVYTPVEYTGVWAGHTYKAEAKIDGHDYDYLGDFSTSGGDAIPNGDMENTAASCYGESNSDSSKVIWGSGNNGITSSLCKPATKPGMGGQNCSKLAAIYKMSNLAAGNLFLGTFEMDGANGTVHFGIKYTYTARPKGLRFKYHAKIGNVEYNKKGGPLPVKDNDGNPVPDQASVYFTIMDWSVRRGVTSGMGNPTGMWSADAQANLAGCGAILGYGTMFISGETEGESMIEGYIPVSFYDKDAAAPQGNYTLTIACSTSRYGDYMNGNSSNVLYVDDFEWVY